MSRYLQRLLDRGAAAAPPAPPTLGATEVAPGPTLGSPLLSFDQRLMNPALARDFGILGMPPEWADSAEPAESESPVPLEAPPSPSPQGSVPPAAPTPQASDPSAGWWRQPRRAHDEPRPEPQAPASPLARASGRRPTPVVGAPSATEPRAGQPPALDPAAISVPSSPPPAASAPSRGQALPASAPPPTAAQAPAPPLTLPPHGDGLDHFRPEIRQRSPLPPEPAAQPKAATREPSQPPSPPPTRERVPLLPAPPLPIAPPIGPLAASVPDRAEIERWVRDALQREREHIDPGSAPATPRPAATAAGGDPPAPRRPATAREASLIGDLEPSSRPQTIYSLRRR